MNNERPVALIKYIQQLCNDLRKSIDECIINIFSDNITNKKEEKVLEKKFENTFKKYKYIYLVEKVTITISNWTEGEKVEVIGAFNDVNKADEYIQNLYKNKGNTDYIIKYKIIQIPLVENEIRKYF